MAALLALAPGPQNPLALAMGEYVKKVKASDLNDICLARTGSKFQLSR